MVARGRIKCVALVEVPGMSIETEGVVVHVVVVVVVVVVVSSERRRMNVGGRNCCSAFQSKSGRAIQYISSADTGIIRG